MNEREIIQAMEACRLGADDLPGGDSAWAAVLADNPAFRQRCERIQGWDRAIGHVLSEVPVPDGMADRLLQTLAAQAAGGQEPSGLSQPAPTSSPVRPPVVRPSGRTVRRWIAAAASLAAAAVLLLAVFVSRQGRPVPQPTVEFAAEVIAWSEALADQPWRTDFTAAELAEYRFDPGIRAVPRRWTWLQTPYHPKTLVYDLTPPRGDPVYLYCLPAPPAVSHLPGAPPERPFSTTAGTAVGMWQRGDLVYVLSVQGGQRRYRGLIDSTLILGRIAPPPPALLAKAA